jgi:hypothetical protein
MPEMKWTRNGRIEGYLRAGARPQESRLPGARKQARRMEPRLGSEPEELVATVRIAHPSPRLSAVSAALEDSPAESRNQGTAERTKRTRQSASAIRIRCGFECNWLYPWRGRNVSRFIFARTHGPEHFCDAGVFRHEMANGTGEICLRTEAADEAFCRYCGAGRRMTFCITAYPEVILPVGIFVRYLTDSYPKPSRSPLQGNVVFRRNGITAISSNPVFV